MPGAGGRRAVWYSGFAVYAAGVALFSGPGLDHYWGAWAAGGYAIAALITVVTPARPGARLGRAARGRGQPRGGAGRAGPVAHTKSHSP